MRWRFWVRGIEEVRKEGERQLAALLQEVEILCAEEAKEMKRMGTYNKVYNAVTNLHGKLREGIMIKYQLEDNIIRSVWKEEWKRQYKHWVGIVWDEELEECLEELFDFTECWAIVERLVKRGRVMFTRWDRILQLDIANETTGTGLLQAEWHNKTCAFNGALMGKLVALNEGVLDRKGYSN